MRSAVYSIGAVDTSPDGGFLHRSVFGGAAKVKDPSHSGTASSGTLRGVKEELAGGIVSRAGKGEARVVGGVASSAERAEMGGSGHVGS